METIRSLNELSRIQVPVHLALGAFDGLHLGHQAVIRHAVEQARKLGGRAAVLTFANHPLDFISPEKAPRLLSSDTEAKKALLSHLGIDLLILLDFDSGLASLTADNFLRSLAGEMQLASISVGTDWRFGKGRSGSLDYLRREAPHYGFSVHAIPPVLDKRGRRISSTAIRHAVARGRFSEAAELLGHDYTLAGKVIDGKKLARQLGFPTANLDTRNAQLPPCGVYLVEATLPDGTICPGIANLGLRPTVEREPAAPLLEVHLLDREDTLYGKELHVSFLDFIRDEKKFSSLNELKEQIARDKALARELIKQKAGI